MWQILKERGIPDHFTCLLRNMYASQEATVRTGHGTTDSKLGKEYIKVVHAYTISLISHASKAILKILQDRLQQYMNLELPDV